MACPPDCDLLLGDDGDSLVGVVFAPKRGRRIASSLPNCNLPVPRDAVELAPVSHDDKIVAAVGAVGMLGMGRLAAADANLVAPGGDTGDPHSLRQGIDGVLAQVVGPDGGGAVRLVLVHNGDLLRGRYVGRLKPSSFLPTLPSAVASSR